MVYSSIDRLELLKALENPNGRTMFKNEPFSNQIIPYSDISEKETFTMKMQHDNAKLKHENAALKNANAALTSKLQSIQESGGGITNNTNNINITHIHINNYGKENTDYITDDFLVKAIKRHTGSVPALLKHLHFHPEHPENHNVRMPNKRDKYMQVLRNGEWKHENRRKVIDSLVEQGKNYIMDSDVYNDGSPNVPTTYRKYMERMHDEDDHVLSDVCNDVEIMLLDNR